MLRVDEHVENRFVELGAKCGAHLFVITYPPAMPSSASNDVTDSYGKLCKSFSALGGVGQGRELPSTSEGGVEATETPAATAKEPRAGAGEGSACATTAEGAGPAGLEQRW